MAKEYHHLEYDYAAALVSLHMVLFVEAMKAGFNPNQPRVPSGNPAGGQWTGTGGGVPGYGYEANPVREPTGATERPSWQEVAGAGAVAIGSVFGRGAIGRWRAAQAFSKTRWTLGKHKSALKWKNRMEQRGWTDREITETLKSGKKLPAINKVNPKNPAIRYVHPKTGKSLVRDERTKEILQVGDKRFYYD